MKLKSKRVEPLLSCTPKTLREKDAEYEHAKVKLCDSSKVSLNSLLKYSSNPTAKRTEKEKVGKVIELFSSKNSSFQKKSYNFDLKSIDSTLKLKNGSTLYSTEREDSKNKVCLQLSKRETFNFSNSLKIKPALSVEKDKKLKSIQIKELSLRSEASLKNTAKSPQRSPDRKLTSIKNVEKPGKKPHNSSVPANKKPPKQFDIVGTELNKLEFNMSFQETQKYKGGTELVKETLESSADMSAEKIRRLIFKTFDKNPSGRLMTKLDFYKTTKLVGKGTYGKVYKAIHRLSGNAVAIKCVEKCTLKNQTMVEKIFQEVQLLSLITHKNIVKLYEIFENSKYYFFVTEYAELGDLMKLLKEKIYFTESQIFLILRDIVSALEYLHDSSIIHRDVKLDNILLTQKYRAKLCDFGISAVTKPGKIFREKCGTPAYLAPEVIRGSYSGFSIDVRL